MERYKGFNYSVMESQTGYFAEGFDEGGSVVYGFGEDESEACDDLKKRIDEYETFFPDLV